MLSTITHARLRAAQGDVATAREILEAILKARPEDAEASALLRELRGSRGMRHAEPLDPPPGAPIPADAGNLAGRFREALGRAPAGDSGRVRRRLEILLDRIREAKGTERAR